VLGSDRHAFRLAELQQAGQLEELPAHGVTFLPPVLNPRKILCVGLNYMKHLTEAAFARPTYPLFFARFASGLGGHRGPLVRPVCSVKLDFEGELVAVIGKPVRHASVHEALGAVVGYSIFNDATIREYQLDRGSQWTLGKNFDGTGGFGPFVVSANDLPTGGSGLAIKTV